MGCYPRDILNKLIQRKSIEAAILDLEGYHLEVTESTETFKNAYKNAVIRVITIQYRQIKNTCQQHTFLFLALQP